MTTEYQIHNLAGTGRRRIPTTHRYVLLVAGKIQLETDSRATVLRANRKHVDTNVVDTVTQEEI